MSAVTSMAFSKNGWEMITAGRDKILSVWNLRENNLKKTIPTFEASEAIAMLDASTKKALKLSTESSVVVTGGEKGLMRFWDIESGKCLKEQGGNYQITNLVYPFI
jgi:U3 small nucleolar RNA-associated protein 13